MMSKKAALGLFSSRTSSPSLNQSCFFRKWLLNVSPSSSLPSCLAAFPEVSSSPSCMQLFLPGHNPFSLLFAEAIYSDSSYLLTHHLKLSSLEQTHCETSSPRVFVELQWVRITLVLTANQGAPPPSRPLSSLPFLIVPHLPSFSVISLLSSTTPRRWGTLSQSADKIWPLTKLSQHLL